jgi:hypothetical protein
MKESVITLGSMKQQSWQLKLHVEPATRCLPIMMLTDIKLWWLAITPGGNRLKRLLSYWRTSAY